MNHINSMTLTEEQIVSQRNLSKRLVHRTRNQVLSEEPPRSGLGWSDDGTKSCAVTVGSCWTVQVSDMLGKVGMCDLSLGLAALLLLAARQTAAESRDSKNTRLCKHGQHL